MTHIPGIHEKMTRSTVQAVYDQVIDDLERALDLFNDPAPNEYLASPDACKALLARVYLYMEDYEKAGTFAREVMDRYPLTPRDRYRAMFNTVGTRGGEGIFRLNNLDNTMALATFYKYENPSGRPSGKLKSLFRDDRDVRLTLFRHTAYSDALKRPVDYEDVNMKYWCTDSLAENLKHYDPFLFRSSEMYLVHAEAACRRGDVAAAEEDIRALEARALGISPDEVSLDYAGDDGLLALVKEERVKELCFEGHRLFDITRYHDTLSRDEGTTASIRTLRFPDYRFILPIPQIEMESNDKMVQNPVSND